MSTDWRQRYLDLADQAEADRRSHEDAERELGRLITRLCVACSGLDPALDPHLKRLREAARGGRTATLLRHAGEFADSLVQATEERARPGVLGRLLAHVGRPGDDILPAWAAVAADPAHASDAALDRLAQLLFDGPASPGGELRSGAKGAARPGLLGRLIGRGDDAAATAPNRVLLELLAAIDWPQEFSARVEGFRHSLAGAGQEDAWVAVVREISDLAVQALGQAQLNARSAENFLTELNRRLEDLDRHMLDEVQRRTDSHDSGARLGRTMDDEVVSLTASVRNSASLVDLQAEVIGSLDRIRTHVRQHLDDENRRRSDAESEAGRLRKQLRRLEQDTFDLRRQVAQTYREAMRDPLTGLANRRAYDLHIAQEYARWKRFGDPLALLVLDVDNFKQVNDRFGHASGDKALVMIARVLGERLRETDFLARYGGEEFVVLFIGADSDDALRLAEAMRGAVEQSGLHAKGEPVSITISGGLSLFAAGDTPQQVFERADAALYQAKRSGKNCIVVAPAAA